MIKKSVVCLELTGEELILSSQGSIHYIQYTVHCTVINYKFKSLKTISFAKLLVIVYLYMSNLPKLESHDRASWEGPDQNILNRLGI